MFLTPQELQRLTGYAPSSAQIRWLHKNGWGFTVNALREPIVAIAESERKLVSGKGMTRHHEPNFGALNGGRRRKQDTHLPKRMYMRRGAYYFCHPQTNEWQPLGKDIAAAFAAHGKLVGGQWSGHNLGEVIDRYRTEVLPLKRSAKTRTDQAKQFEKLKVVFGDMPPDKITAQLC